LRACLFSGLRYFNGRSVGGSGCGRSRLGYLSTLSGLVRADKMNRSKSSEDFFVLILLEGIQITPQGTSAAGLDFVKVTREEIDWEGSTTEDLTAGCSAMVGGACGLLRMLEVMVRSDRRDRIVQRMTVRKGRCEPCWVP